MQIKSKILPLFAIIAFCGCSSRVSHINSMIQKLTVSESQFLTITNGITTAAITNQFGISVRHEFTVREGSNTLTLASCLVPDPDGACFYLLFRDDTLVKVIKPPRPELETIPYDGTTWTRIKSWSLEDTGYINKTINASALTPQQIADDLASATNETSGSWNVFPAFFLSGYAWKEMPKIESGYETNEYLLTHYNGFCAHLGINTNESLKLFGQPSMISQMKNTEEAWIYKGYPSSEINSYLAFNGVAIVFDATGHSVAVYSHNYFNDDWGK